MLVVCIGPTKSMIMAKVLTGLSSDRGGLQDGCDSYVGPFGSDNSDIIIVARHKEQVLPLYSVEYTLEP